MGLVPVRLSDTLHGEVSGSLLRADRRGGVARFSTQRAGQLSPSRYDALIVSAEAPARLPSPGLLSLVLWPWWPARIAEGSYRTFKHFLGRLHPKKCPKVRSTPLICPTQAVQRTAGAYMCIHGCTCTASCSSSDCHWTPLIYISFPRLIGSSVCAFLYSRYNRCIGQPLLPIGELPVAQRPSLQSLGIRAAQTLCLCKGHDV